MTPTPEMVAKAIVERFAQGKPEDVDLSSHDWYVREIMTALTEQAQEMKLFEQTLARQVREIERLKVCQVCLVWVGPLEIALKDILGQFCAEFLDYESATDCGSNAKKALTALPWGKEKR